MNSLAWFVCIFRSVIG